MSLKNSSFSQKNSCFYEASLIYYYEILSDGFFMNDIPSTCMLLTFASSSTLYTSLPLTIGLKYGLLRLTILFVILSLLSLS